MDDLVQWFGEQLDDDERIARAAAHGEAGEWTNGGSYPVSVAGDLPEGADAFERAVAFDEGSPSEEQAAHIARHDPARVLRDIAADRKLLALFVEVGAREVDLDDAFEYAHGWVNALGMAVRLRASAFSERRGYREEWRPY